MNLTAEWIASGWYWAADLVLLALLVAALRTRPWRWLETDSRVHAFAGATVACMMLWSISGRVGSGPGFHLLGTTVLTLMFGPRLALLATVLALAGVTAAGRAGWQAFGMNALLMGALPIGLSFAIYRWVDRTLPNHFFVYVFVTAFLNGGLAMGVSRMASRAIEWAAGAMGPVVEPLDYMLASVLLGWGEALTTGMMMTVFVIYRPGWVQLFDDARYLLGR